MRTMTLSQSMRFFSHEISKKLELVFVPGFTFLANLRYNTAVFYKRTRIEDARFADFVEHPM
ncbi:hypothetical protein F443_22640 [Phytophthora nicotianae P1569]|uniref:Uncharacterized protein n=1 Tax=Phytophthora nicotianae P1569 TaxID=1317065 RepID=V9DTQ1_PHYNI|nr:hypothetical protein F443_22640 [Phytophthora nicotianae P1569]